jgi:hypothetical protein
MTKVTKFNRRGGGLWVGWRWMEHIRGERWWPAYRGSRTACRAWLRRVREPLPPPETLPSGGRCRVLKSRAMILPAGARPAATVLQGFACWIPDNCRGRPPRPAAPHDLGEVIKDEVAELAKAWPPTLAPEVCS